MNTLTANIQREWLARILDGSKKIEYRDLSEYWINRLNRVGPPPFRFRLINGMKADSPEVTILVNKVDIDLLRASIRFHLGDVISKLRWDSTWHVKYPPVLPDPPFDPKNLDAQSLKRSRIRLKAPREVYDNTRMPGVHHFDLPLDETICGRLLKQGLAPFMLKLLSGDSSVEVVVYELFYELFDGYVKFAVLTL